MCKTPPFTGNVRASLSISLARHRDSTLARKAATVDYSVSDGYVYINSKYIISGDTVLLPQQWETRNVSGFM